MRSDVLLSLLRCFASFGPGIRIPFGQYAFDFRKRGRQQRHGFELIEVITFGAGIVQMLFDFAGATLHAPVGFEIVGGDILR